MAQRGMNTMSEGLSSMASMCAELMAYPDADVEWLADLQAQIIAKMRAGNPSIPDEGGMGGGPGLPPGMGGGANGLPSGMGGMMMPGGGVSAGGSVPNAGELQRVLSVG